MSEQIISPKMRHLMQLVHDAGGSFVGIQETLLAAQPALLGFVNFATEKYLVVPFDPQQPAGPDLLMAVQDRIRQDNEEYSNRHVWVKVADLRRISKQLLELSQQIDAILERKKA